MLQTVARTPHAPAAHASRQPCGATPRATRLLPQVQQVAARSPQRIVAAKHPEAAAGAVGGDDVAPRPRGQLAADAVDAHRLPLLLREARGHALWAMPTIHADSLSQTAHTAQGEASNAPLAPLPRATRSRTAHLPLQRVDKRVIQHKVALAAHHPQLAGVGAAGGALAR